MPIKSAELETDFARLNTRIEEALTAIGKTLDGTAELDDAEHKEIQDAYSPFRR